MKELIFHITRDDKPIVFIKNTGMNDIACLIDTGANIPVWLADDKFLSQIYPDAQKTSKKTILSGIGEEPIKDVPIWLIPRFALIDDNDEKLIYENLFVAVTGAVRFSFDMILPLTMLNRMRFSFDYSASVRTALFHVSASQNKYFVRPIFTTTNNDILNKVQIFAQEDI